MGEKKTISVLEFYDLNSAKREILKEFNHRIEAPNWTPDGQKLVYNAQGQIYLFDLHTLESTKVFTGECTRCNNDHVLSKDGKTLAISAGTEDEPKSRAFVLPITGGEPRLVTKSAPSYLHGISPDGKTIAYCAERNGQYDIYTIGIEGGPETRLTTTDGLNDGPEYSSSGETIWFNSVRTGLMQVFRMNKDGSAQTQMTSSCDLNSWFPHISPDNQKLVFVSYHKDDVAPGDHPANKNIEIRMMDADGGGLTTLLQAFGGQGTMNVNSWAPSSDRFAFVSYRFEE